jgi:hypothetical protein
VRHDGRVRRRRSGGVAATLLVAALASGCGTASEPSPPTGVDQLVIPTPSVDPQDFVEGIDNPWLPLAPGATWSYRVSGTPGGVDDEALTVTVRDQPETVAGVAATVVDTRGPAGDRTDFYAQDRGGNVWWLGRDGVWRAGDDGAEAGLAMPRHPRIGDGWRTAFLAGVVEDHTEVTATDAAFTTPAGSFTGAVQLETASPLEPDRSTQDSYARGVGLVRTVATDGPAYLAVLVSGP